MSETTTGTASGEVTTGDRSPEVAAHTPGPWLAFRIGARGWKIYRGVEGGQAICQLFDSEDQPFLDDEANALAVESIPEMLAALNYVADMTYIGADAEWHFKPSYDPQRVLDVIAKATSQGSPATNHPSNAKAVVS